MYQPLNNQEDLGLTLTENAIRQVKLILARDKKEGHGLRVGVTDGGCSGFSYKLDFDKEQKPQDTVREWDGLKVYVDRDSSPYLKGTVIDFVAGIYGGGFKFTNPNAKASCSCGESFSV